MKKRARAKRRAEIQRRIKTPEAVIGRKHIDIQTDLYLEELSEKVPEAVAATQTDAFLDRAPSPLYIPQKSGLDVATQVYPGELFDFNYEVEPILEVLVAKTVEQALMEVMEEEELATLKKYQVGFYYNYLIKSINIYLTSYKNLIVQLRKTPQRRTRRSTTFGRRRTPSHGRKRTSSQRTNPSRQRKTRSRRKNCSPCFRPKLFIKFGALCS